MITKFRNISSSSAFYFLSRNNFSILPDAPGYPLKICTLPKYQNIKVSINLITTKEFDDALDITAKIFLKKEPLMLTADISKRIFIQNGFCELCKISMHDKLAFIAKDFITGEIAGIRWALDRTSFLSQSRFINNQKVKEIFDLYEFIEKKAFSKIDAPRYKYEQIFGLASVVSEKFSGLNIGLIMANYMVNEYPLTKQTRLFYGFSTSTISKKMMEKIGMKSILELKYSELNSMKRFSSLQNVDAIIKREGLSLGNTMDLMIKTRHGFSIS